MVIIHIIGYVFELSQPPQSFMRIILGLTIIAAFSYGKILKRITIFLLILVCGQLSEFICIPVCSQFYNIAIENVSVNKSHMMFVMLLTSDMLFIFLLVTAIIWKRKELLSQKNFSKLGIMILFVAIHIVITMFYYMDTSVLDNVRHQIVQTILQALLYIALVFNYFNSLHTVKLMKSEENLRQLETEMEHNYMYYTLADEKFTEISQLRHDILNQIQTVQHMLSVGEGEQAAKEIMDNIEEQLVSTKTVRFCRNPIINAVLTIKMNAVRANKIDTDIILEDCDNLPFDNYEVCSLFANLYDNAVEACQKLEEDKDRFIEMRSGVKNGYFVLKIRNSCLEMKEFKNDKLPKTDKDSKEHGYGTRIIESITKKYDGNFTMHYENEIMQAVVALKTDAF